LLLEVLEEAQKLLKSLERPAAPPPAPSPTTADTHPDLALAAAALQSGNLEEAVRLAHRASASAPEDPAVFRRMIEVHVTAADASPQHDQALRWLLCAHSHDQASKAIHQHLARRYRLQARSLADAGLPAEALEAANRSLAFEPFNAGARALAEELEKRLVQAAEETP
jgi:hypothetical protein